MIKAEDLVIGELYQYKDENFEIWGFYNGLAKNLSHEFKTVSSVNNAWKNEIFQVDENEGDLKYITKLS
jgi:hypothetical protein